ncbi:MAG TPA: DUF4430 domain-containing protein [Solirubrobacterales bacterium]|jgi:hypothetical protein|nr:DUF4430 domain-containing protein [Solirubrobacterales bacterium]
MNPSRTAVAVAVVLLAAAFAAAGCGLGPGESVGDVSLTVTHDFGTERLLGPSDEEARESDTVMRLLESHAEIATRYGGGFVQSIDGLSAARRGDREYDWFFYVNGVESSVGAAEYGLHDGDAVWWDYRDWSAAQSVPAVVGAWPQPFRDGYGGRHRPVAVECRGGGAACGEVAARLRAAGASPVAATTPGEEGAPAGALRMLVGPWSAVRGDPAAKQIEEGPQASGVFARFAPAGAGGYRLMGLDEGGGAVRGFGPATGLVAATRRYGSPPVWVVTGATTAAAAAAARLLDAADLRDRYAVAVARGAKVPLPIAGSGG